MKSFTIVCLNETFFKKHAGQSEILEKPNRPHLVLLISVGQKTFAIPFRTNAHKPKTGGVAHCFFFETSGRRPTSTAGRIPALDFSKAVVIEEEDVGQPTIIDKNEFKELKDNIHIVKQKFVAYLKFYIESVRAGENLDLPQIKYSTLQYFSSDLAALDLAKKSPVQVMHEGNG